MKLMCKVKYYLIRLFRLKSSPHKVSIGFVMGFIPHWVPTFGLSPLLSIGLAKLVRGNTVSAFVSGVIGTPIWPLLFILNYQVGSFLFDRKPKFDELEDVEYIDAIHDTYGGLVHGGHSSGFLFIAGAIIDILISTIVIYFIIYFLFKKYRLKILRTIRGR